MSLRNKKLLKNGMVLYHGSNEVVQYPEIRKTMGYKDFGDGFYTTVEIKQAKTYAIRVDKRFRELNGNVSYETSHPVVNIYKVSTIEDLNIKHFKDATVSWLRFVCRNRDINIKDKNKHGKDIIIGKIADDDTKRVLDEYMYGDKSLYREIAKMKGLTVEQEVISRLLTDRLEEQLLFATQKALSRIIFIGKESLLNGKWVR
ncbi:MAG: DUF3990 domain-containing protein [Oscillospiraceae bacterium]|nr:DUF3990 domain-containing protein [Oscillospiraceae bacterium]